MIDNKILNLFFENSNKEFYIREIARVIKIHPNTVMKQVNFLVKEGLLIRKKTKVTVQISANIENPKFIYYKRINNLKKIYDSGVIEYLIEKFNHPEAIVLYGSYSKGEDTEKSDIDIAIVTKRSIELDLTEFEKKLKKSIHLIDIIPSKAQKEFINNLINGITLYGNLSVL